MERNFVIVPIIHIKASHHISYFFNCSLLAADWFDALYIYLKRELKNFKLKHLFTELRLARLALDPSNSPSWEIPDQEARPCTKMPLFVAAHPVYTSQQQSEVSSKT